MPAVSIDFSTILHCVEALPHEFLLGCGLTTQQIADVKNWTNFFPRQI